MKHRLIFTTAIRPELKLRAQSASPLEVDSNQVSVVFRRLELLACELIRRAMKYLIFTTALLFLSVLSPSALLAQGKRVLSLDGSGDYEHPK